MRKLGLKLWSKDFIKNIDFAKSAEASLKDGVFDYLELFALPDSFDETKDKVYDMFYGIKTIIHAPHNIQQLNIADKNEFLNNKKRLSDSQKFADLLDSPYIILHPGMGKSDEFLDESMRQFIDFHDSRLTVENLPSYCSQTKNELHGIRPFEIKRFIDEANALFCLDFSHAICGANACNENVFSFLSEMKALNPVMYHLCDGDFSSTNDSHLHFGEGDYDLRRLVLEYTTEDALITMETGHGIPVDVKPWIDDASYFRKAIS